LNTITPEIELKLRVDPEKMDAVIQAPTLTAAPSGGATLVVASSDRERLRATYFDTADHQLHARALSLRVRCDGKQFIQTLKAGDAGPSGLHHRIEWEAPVTENRLDLTALPREACSHHLDGIALSDLVAVFETDVERTTRRLDGTATIEVAIDRGEIRAGDAVLPIAEIELELKFGPTQALFDLALELARQEPVRVETRSKAERGYTLATGGTRCAVKAGRLALDPEVTGDDALAGIIRHCISHMIANEACVTAGIDPEGIHQMRVALRRLRSALVLFRPFVPAEQYTGFNAEVKWLAGCLGDARDWDAYTASLLAPVRSALPNADELTALASAVDMARGRSYQAAQEAVGSARYTILLLQLQAWLEARAWRNPNLTSETAPLFRPVGDLADKLLGKRHRSVCKRGRHFPTLAPEARHEVRKELKKLRYAVEFFQNLYAGKRLKRYLQRLEALQEDLGHLNDVATARSLTERLKKQNPQVNGDWRIGSGLVMGWHTQAAGILEPHLIEHWQRFAAAKPFWC
jgi:triphosphatase